MTARSLRLLHVSQPVDYGVGRYLSAVVERQVRWGIDVVVACPEQGPLATAVRAAGARHEPWQATRDPGFSLPREVASLRRVVDEVRPDVVHLHSSKAGLVGRLLRRSTCPTIFQPHAWAFNSGAIPMRTIARYWERVAAAWTDAFVCGSTAEMARGARAGIEGDWHLVPNSVDLDRFPFTDDRRRRAVRRQLGIGPHPTAVCVGRLCRQKGQDLLLRAWPAVLEGAPDAQLVLVGEGPDRPSIESLAVPGVRLVGAQDDVRPWLEAADVVVQPSRYETMALSMLEAMAVGRSVVATDVEGAAEALGRGSRAGGAVVRQGSPDAIARALTERLTDTALADAEGRMGRSRAAAHHDLDRAVRLLTDIAEDAATRPSERHGATNRRPREAA